MNNSKANEMNPQGGEITRTSLANIYRLTATSLNTVLKEVEPELNFETKGKRVFSSKEYAKILEVLGQPNHN